MMPARTIFALLAVMLTVLIAPGAAGAQTKIVSKVQAGVSSTPTFTVTNNSSFAVDVTSAVVVFTKAPIGFNASQDFADTFAGAFTVPSQPQATSVQILSYLFTQNAPLGTYDFTVDLYGTASNGYTGFLGTPNQSIVDRLVNAAATPEPAPLLALLLGALALVGLMLLRRRGLSPV